MKMTLNEEIEYLQSGNWYDKVRAVLPTDEYLKLGWAIGDILETLELFRSLAPEPQTNADRIRAMSDEELATMLFDYKECNKNCIMNSGKHCYEICEEESCILKWLQQPAEEEEGCHEWATGGRPTPDGYKRLCGRHFAAYESRAEAEAALRREQE